MEALNASNFKREQPQLLPESALDERFPTLHANYHLRGFTFFCTASGHWADERDCHSWGQAPPLGIPTVLILCGDNGTCVNTRVEREGVIGCLLSLFQSQYGNQSATNHLITFEDICGLLSIIWLRSSSWVTEQNSSVEDFCEPVQLPSTRHVPEPTPEKKKTLLTHLQGSYRSSDWSECRCRLWRLPGLIPHYSPCTQTSNYRIIT